MTGFEFDTNPVKPMLHFPLWLLRLWARDIEMFADNYEKELDKFSSEAEHQREVEQQEQQYAAYLGG